MTTSELPLPLAGQRVLITRPAHQTEKLATALQRLGAQPIIFPTIEIRAVADIAPLDAALQRLTDYDWLIITSANGVAVILERLTVLGLSPGYLTTIALATVGPATAAALELHQIKPNFIPTVHTAAGLLEELSQLVNLTGQRILLPQANIARPTLADGLTAAGAQVTAGAIYETVPLSAGPPPPAADVVTFTSSSTVQGYVNCLADQSPAEWLRHSQVVCIGPVTAQTATELGLPVTAIAEPHTIEGLVAAILNH